MGYGATQLAGPHVYGPPRDRAEALRVLRRAVELGVDHGDTDGWLPWNCPADRLGARPAQVALAWVRTVPGTLLIPGTSSVPHLQQNSAAADLVLDDQALQELARP